MPISKKTEKILQALCIALYQEYPKDKYDSKKHLSHLIRVIPYDIKDGGASVFLYGKYHLLYHQAFSALRNELAVEFMHDNELHEELWHLTCEIILQRTLFPMITDVKKKVQEFSANVAKPLKNYEILVPISNIDLNDKKFHFNEGYIKKFDSRTLSEWGIYDDNTHPHSFKRFLNKSCLVIPEVGNNRHLVTNRAREKAKYLLKLLQVALSSSRKLTDWELLYSIGKEVAIRNEGNPDSVGYNWERGFTPIPRTIDNILETDVNQFLHKINPILLDKKYGANLKKSFKNAITWIGRAIEEDDSDLGIIFLSTSLESILTTRSEGRKGELIAYRMLLLNTFIEQSFTHPSRVLYVYELRSKVIHGGELFASSKDDQRTLRHVARETVINASIAIQKMGITKKTEFHRQLESDKKTVELIGNWLRAQGDPRSIQIVNYMEDNINQ